MAASRYARDGSIRQGTTRKTARSARIIQRAVYSGRVRFGTQTLRGFSRLDVVAGKYYGDGKYWWIIAAASGVGWGLQVPPGTRLVIPNLDQVLQLLL